MAMRVETMLLADNADIQNGTVKVIRDITHGVGSGVFPFVHPPKCLYVVARDIPDAGTMVVSMAFPDNETEQLFDRTATADIVEPGGTTLYRALFYIDPVEIHVPGNYEFRLRYNGEVIGAIPYVVIGPPGVSPWRRTGL